MGTTQLMACPPKLNCFDPAYVIIEPGIKRSGSTNEESNMMKTVSSRQKLKIFEASASSTQLQLKTLIRTKFHAQIYSKSVRSIQYPQECTDENRQSIVVYVPMRDENTDPTNKDIYAMVQPPSTSRRSDEDDEIKYLWNAAVKTQQELINVEVPKVTHLQKRNICETYKDGSIYNGESFKNTRHGNGRLVDRNGLTIYDGEWKLGQYNGEGTLYFWSGSNKPLTKANLNQCALDPQFLKSYTGTFEENKYHGNGVLVYNDGSSLYGTFKDGKPNGTFTFESAGGLIFTFWENGKLVKFLTHQQHQLRAL